MTEQQEHDADTAEFVQAWWRLFGVGQATLLKGLEIAYETHADFDVLVADGVVVVEGGMVRLSRAPVAMPEPLGPTEGLKTPLRKPHKPDGGYGAVGEGGK